MSYTPNFVAPQGPGRPLDRNDKPIKFNNFAQGTDQYFSTLVSSGSDISRTINARCFEGTTLNRRKGKILVGTLGSAGKNYMEAVLQVSNGDDIHLRLIDGAGSGVQLQKYDVNSSDWVDIGSNIGNAYDRVDWSWTSIRIAGEDRVYFTDGVSEMRYTNGVAITTVPDIYCKYVSNIGNRLIAGNFTATFNPNQVLYAKANSHQFWSDLDANLAGSTQTFTLPGQVTQVKGFNSLGYIFTKSDGLFEVDLFDETIRQISTHGTIAPKSVSVGWDVMIWTDQTGVWAMPLGGNILKISKKVDAIYQNVYVDNVFQLVGHINSNGEYELHMGDLTYLGVEYTNYCLIYDIEASRFENSNIWREDYGREFANNAVNWTNPYGFTQTYYGSRTTQSTYQSDYEYEDGVGNSIALIMETKDVTVVDEKQEYLLGDIYIKYKPDGATTIPLTIKARCNTEAWQTIKTVDLPAGSSSMEIARIQGIKGFRGRTFALRLESTDSKEFSIYEIYITYSYNNSDIRPL